MGYVHCNPNPSGKQTGDCVIRAISIITGQDWEQTYIEVCLQGLMEHEMPSTNSVWGKLLESKGFRCSVIPNECPDCITINEFCEQNPHGAYILATGSHVVACIDGNYLDAWDSGREVPMFIWQKEV